MLPPSDVVYLMGGRRARSRGRIAVAVSGIRVHASKCSIHRHGVCWSAAGAWWRGASRMQVPEYFLSFRCGA
eukprot:2745552-Alexandrium_andersonii.AAC.1